MDDTKQEYPKIVYVEACVLANGEVFHFGKSLGFIDEAQAELLDRGATKLTKGSEPIIRLGRGTA